MSLDPCIEYFNMGPWPFYCGFTTSKKKFKAEMARLGIDPAPDFVTTDHANATTHFLERRSCLTAIIAMPKPKGDKHSPEQIAGLLAHEATHVAQELWRSIGEKRPGDEAEAYLVQHIVQCCLQIAYNTNRVRQTEP